MSNKTESLDTLFDLHNAAKRYAEGLDDEGGLLLVAVDTTNADGLTFLYGDSESVISLMINMNGIVTLDTPEKELQIAKMKDMILTAAINILNADRQAKKIFEEALKALK